MAYLRHQLVSSHLGSFGISYILSTITSQLDQGSLMNDDYPKDL